MNIANPLLYLIIILI